MDSHPIKLPPLSEQKAVTLTGLENVVAYSPKLTSGSAPAGRAGFAALRSMGIATIISVDGAKPDIEQATEFGLRYVHLPIAYNGMDQYRALELARAVRDLPGPIYIHCHHGKHRSAAAAAVVSVMLGDLSNEQAIARMKVSGTSPAYPGLYQCAGGAKPADKALLDSARADFPQVYRTTDLVDAMVLIDDSIERLKLLEKAGWRPPADHPDLVPAAEAGRLTDLLRNLSEIPAVKSRPAEFAEFLSASSKCASQLEESLVQPDHPRASLSRQLQSTTQSCNTCHSRYRN